MKTNKDHVQDEATAQPVRDALTVSVKVRSGETELAHQFRPEWVQSYCPGRVPFGTDANEHIQVAGAGTTVTLFVDSCRARSSLAESIEMGQLPVLYVHKSIIGVRLVIHERGWPSESPRRIFAEHRHPEDGVTEYSRTFTPRTPAPGVCFLAAGWHHDRIVKTLLDENVESISVEKHRVVVAQKADLGGVTLLTKNAETATRLAAALRAETVQTIEINEFVRGIIVGMGNEDSLIFGFDNLSANDQRELVEAGARNIGREELTSGHAAYMIVKPFEPPTRPSGPQPGQHA